MLHDTELCNAECCHDRKINVVVASVFLEILYFGSCWNDSVCLRCYCQLMGLLSCTLIDIQYCLSFTLCTSHTHLSVMILKTELRILSEAVFYISVS